MSCCLIIQKKYEFALAVDSAIININPSTGEIKRSRKKSDDKLKKFGKDVVFVAGYGKALEEIPTIIESCIGEDEHINLNKLHDVLKNKYPVDKNILEKYGYFEYGVTIFRFENGVTRTYDIAQNTEGIQQFKLSGNNNTFLLVAGTKTEELHRDAKKEIKETNKLNVVSLFQKHHSEGLGNEIFLYSFKNETLTLEESHKLIEDDLVYDDDEILEEYAISHIYSSNIKGSVINGNELRGNDIYVKDKLYIYDSTEDENGNVGQDFEALKIQADAWNSGNTSYNLILGSRDLASVTIPCQLNVRYLNGGTAITSLSSPTDLNWNDADNWTQYGNFRTSGTHNLASVDYVQNYFARKSEIDSLVSRIEAIENK